MTAWDPDQLEILQGADDLNMFQHPRLNMKRAYCNCCGETLYNTNSMNWRVISQYLIRKCLGVLPAELQSQSHFFYKSRVIDIDDSLPKRD